MQRTPLAPRSENSRRGHELTPYARGKIIGAVQLGASPSTIVGVPNVKYSTKHTCNRPQSYRRDFEARQGRPKIYSNRDERHMLRQVRLYPKCTYKEVREACGVSLCNTP
jgi:hypothetical protein